MPTDEPMTAEAKRLGMVNRVVPSGEVFEAARDLADDIVANATLAIEAGKRGIDEGIEAFIEKRDPEFRGR